MQTFRLLALFAAVNLSTGFLAGEEVKEIFSQSAVMTSLTLVQEEAPSMEFELEPALDEEVEETQTVDIMEAAVETEEEPVPEEVKTSSYVEETITEEIPVAEVETEEELTYGQLTQRDVGEEGAPVSEEVRMSWYVEETAATGLQLIIQTYAIDEFYFAIDSTPSKYVYQYELYADSPDGGHVNLIGIFQYDATGKQTYQMDPITGNWD